jgi:hypothetical protein
MDIVMIKDTPTESCTTYRCFHCKNEVIDQQFHAEVKLSRK